MQRIILTTEDGSSTICIPETGVTYHSKFGAVAESRQIFLQAGLQYLLEQHPHQQLSVLEIGFGTGLNALLTADLALKIRIPIAYTSLELFPLEPTEWALLNHGKYLALQEIFESLHQLEWEEKQKVHDYMTLTKHRVSLLDYQSNQNFHAIFFDAFAPEVQPELWTVDVFRKLYGFLHPGGVLTTYCSKTVVRKALQEAGFTVEKIPGPQGKREIVRAKKMQ